MFHLVSSYLIFKIYIYLFRIYCKNSKINIFKIKGTILFMERKKGSKTIFLKLLLLSLLLIHVYNI